MKLEEQIINKNKNASYNSQLVMNTIQLYQMAVKCDATTDHFCLKQLYDYKEKYRWDYNLSIAEMYYNLGVAGLINDEKNRHSYLHSLFEK